MTSSRQIIITFFIVAVICAVILSVVYAFTEPKIIETQKKLIIQSLQEIISAKEFKEITPDTLWQALDSSNNPVGIAFRVFPQGYGGPIPIIVGLDLHRKITGIKVIEPDEGLKETPGLGAKISEPDFTKQFIGKSVEQLAIKKDGGEIDAITGATVSSRAVCNGIGRGIEIYSCYVVNSASNKIANKVFPEAQQFVEIIKDTLWYAVNGCDTLGVVFVSACFGYLDSIKFIVGVNRKGEITRVEILYSKETEGIGEQIRNREFLDKFKGGIPDAISGATISSQALITGLKESLKRFKDYLK